jgi:glycosyltransferase involved in cell wall biosynthesis
LRHGDIALDFSYRLTRIPEPLVRAALQAGTGAFLREALERGDGEGYGLIDLAGNILFPSVKDSFGVVAREASTIHDLSTLVMPENHEEANVLHHMRGLARELATDEVVFCASEATRAALELHYPSVRGKTRILYQFADWPEAFASMDRNLPRLQLGRYAVVVATLEPRKNLALLHRALSLPQLKELDISFIVMGRKGWKIGELADNLTQEQKSRVIFTGFVSEFMKYRLLRHAEFLVMPSVYEGFGIPALEAMSLGKPVLAAMSSSFPEVVGEAGIFFDPFSVSEFVAALQEICDERIQKRFRAKAIAAAAAFDWRRMAAPVVEWVSA